MLHFCEWLQHNSWINALDSNVPMSLFFEIMHYSGFFLLIGTAVLVDLRILGIGARNENPSTLSRQLIPWMWTGLVMVFVSGFFMFSGDAVDFYLANTFRIKILVVLVAVICGAVVQRKTLQWSEWPSIPAGAKVVALISLILWIGSILISVEVPAISGVG
jgi:hypothetical protein